MYSCGPDTPTHTETTRPWLSNVIEPQSRMIIVDCSWGERPSGPPHVNALVCQPSLWMLDVPLGDMCGFCGVRGAPRIGCADGGAPMYAAAGVGSGKDGIGTAGTGITARPPPAGARPTLAGRRPRSSAARRSPA